MAEELRVGLVHLFVRGLWVVGGGGEVVSYSDPSVDKVTPILCHILFAVSTTNH